MFHKVGFYLPGNNDPVSSIWLEEVHYRQASAWVSGFNAASGAIKARMIGTSEEYPMMSEEVIKTEG